MSMLQFLASPNPGPVIEMIEHNYTDDPTSRKAACVGAYMLAHSRWNPEKGEYLYSAEVRNFFDRQAHDKITVGFDLTGYFDSIRSTANVTGVESVESARARHPEAAAEISMGALAAAAAAGNKADYCTYSVMFAEDMHMFFPTKSSAEHLAEDVKRLYDMGLSQRLEGGAAGVFGRAVRTDPKAGEYMRNALRSAENFGVGPLVTILNRAMSRPAGPMSPQPQPALTA
jgi:hypothetical protein